MLVRLILGTFLVSAALASAAGGSVASPSAAAANRATFQDTRAEAPDAPDIRSVVVSNDDAGTITFRVVGPPRLVEGMAIDIYVDSDNLFTTGTPDPLNIGADYVIQLLQGQVDLFQWDGTNFSRRANDPPQSTLAFQDLTIRINASELGNTSRFNFGVLLVSGITVDSEGQPDFSQARDDVAPDLGLGLWPYTVRIAPVRLVARRFSLSPSRPQAGRTLTANLVARRSDTGATLRGGQVVCNATVGGRRLAPRVRRFIGTQARCTWAIPANARGQRLRGSVAVVFEGRRVTRSFAATVG